MLETAETNKKKITKKQEAGIVINWRTSKLNLARLLMLIIRHSRYLEVDDQNGEAFDREISGVITLTSNVYGK